MARRSSVRVAINGYGVIGKRVTDAVRLQDDMELVGVCDVASDWRLRSLDHKGIALYAASDEALQAMTGCGLTVAGTLDALLEKADIIIDCTPKRVGAANVARYRSRRIKFIVHGGEKHAVTGHSFVAESSFASAIGRESTRIVSCNTISIVRTLAALKRAGLLKRARGTLLRRATDPWESDAGGIMNTLVPESEIPSHQGPDARSVDPELDVVTMAVKVPETLGHLHYWAVQLTRPAEKEEVLEAFRASSRIALIRTADGLTAINTVKELMADLDRPRDNLYEVALWEDMLRAEGDELFYAYMVDNQAIVIPETIDAIRALTELASDADGSIALTNASLGIRQRFF
ncbi:type II glyceraldehyde-3-phosphate dehydrogenase [Mesorhizobium sp. VNQ89]|uniref:type II glyceraldehyde-3-phosphate dehydrogenase n=1 Tax=Mesorhizobium quangtriensis TaxID=3157709 RepID=UPI0032B77443